MKKTIKVKRFMCAYSDDYFDMSEIKDMLEDGWDLITIQQEKSEDGNDGYFIVFSFTFIKPKD